MPHFKINKLLANKIVEAVHEVCNCQINFIDQRGTIIASTDASRLNEFHEAGFDAIKQEIPIMVESDAQYVGAKKGVNYPIFMNDHPIAVIGITGEPEDVRKFGFLATKISEIFIREQQMNKREESAKQRMNYFIRSYIYNDLDNIEYLERLLHEFDICKEDQLAVLIVKLNTRYNLQNIAMMEKKIHHLFEELNIVHFTYIYPNEFVGFMKEQNPQQRKVLQNFCENIPQVLSIGIGSVEPLQHIRISYERGKLALKSSRIHETGYQYYDDLTIERILGRLKGMEKRDFLKRVLGNLDDTDKEILRYYFEQNLSLKETASHFYIHINTLQYKLDRIARLTSINPRVFSEASVLYMALLLESI